MINLMPPETKTSIAFARRNRMLIKWIVATSVGILGIVTVILAGYLYINQSIDAYAKEVASAKSNLASQNLEETQARTEEISNNVKLALQVLSRRIIFSALLNQIAAVMPPGASLQNLSIGSLEGGIDLQAVAINEEAATQVQINLSDPTNRIFEKADIINITCSEASDSQTPEQYPCQITIRALFAKDSPFTFTNQNSGGGS